MVAGVFEELARERPRRRFTIGITDDVSGTSLPYDASLDIEAPSTVRAVFFGRAFSVWGTSKGRRGFFAGTGP